MKMYEYEGFDKEYNKHKGTVSATEGEQAILILVQSGIYPTVLQEISKNQKSNIDYIDKLKTFRKRLSKLPQAPPVPEIHPIGREIYAMNKWIALTVVGIALIIAMLGIIKYLKLYG